MSLSSLSAGLASAASGHGPLSGLPLFGRTIALDNSLGLLLGKVLGQAPCLDAVLVHFGAENQSGLESAGVGGLVNIPGLEAMATFHQSHDIWQGLLLVNVQTGKLGFGLFPFGIGQGTDIVVFCHALLGDKPKGWWVAIRQGRVMYVCPLRKGDAALRV